MTKEEIRLSDENSGFPVDICKPKNGIPVSDNFKFRMKNFPQIENRVKKITWNSVDRCVDLLVEETPKFDVIRWIEYSDAQQKTSQTSAFVDLDTNCAFIIFMDGNKKELANIELINLKIEKHNTTLQITPNDCFNVRLHHHITVSYHKSTTSFPPEPPQSKLDEKDREWQQIEILP